MVDTFTVQPKRGDAYKTTDFRETIGRLFADGMIFGSGNDFDIIDQGSPALDIKVDTGVAILDGIFVNLTLLSDAKTMTDSATNHIYIELTDNVSNRVTGAQITINTTGVAPTNPNVKIGEVVTSGGDITSISQSARVSPELAAGGTSGLFGDGSDGDLVISSGTTTITETKYYNSITITGTGILTADEPMLVFVKGTLTIGSGAEINMNAKGGTGGTGGTIGPSAGGPGPAGGPGQPGGTSGGNGAVGTVGVAAGTGGTGGSGGAGGASSPPGSPGPLGGPGGAGGPGTAGSAGVSGTLSRLIRNVFDWLSRDTRDTLIGAGGAGGGAGGRGGGGGGIIGGPGGGGGAVGGAGGAGGGTLVIIANNIDLQTGGKISSNGALGAGGASNPGVSLNGVPGTTPTTSGGGGGSTANGAGGGGGGAGGGIYLVYKRLTEDGTIEVVGGALGTGGSSPGVAHGTGGTGGGTGSPGAAAPNTPGPTGVAGTNGVAGATGVIQKVQV